MIWEQNSNLVQVAHRVIIRPSVEELVLVASRAKCLVQNDTFSEFEQNYPCNEDRGPIGIYLLCLFYAPIVCILNINFKLAKHQRYTRKSDVSRNHAD